VSTTARKAWLKLLRAAGVKHFRATSGLGLPYICYLGDESGEAPFYQLRYSVAEIALMSAWCRTVKSPVVFDIGANNGFIATQLAQLVCNSKPRIYAFEPVPSTFAQLERAVDSLGLNDLVFPVCCGISDSDGIVNVSYNPRQSLFAQLRENAPNPRVGHLSTRAVTLTIDRIVDSLATKPSLLKIDIEGFEPRALRGATRLLASDNPPAICFEWNPLTLSEANSSPSEIIRSLANYCLYYVDDFEGQRKPFGEEIQDLPQISWVCNLCAVPRGDDYDLRWNTARVEALGQIARLR
jgi:FkbM family methyltransferase